MAELADAIDLESITFGVQVRFLLSAPFNFMSPITIIGLFLLYVLKYQQDFLLVFMSYFLSIVTRSAIL